jgi:tetratricopeptide (TPR) repeat protein
MLAGVGLAALTLAGCGKPDADAHFAKGNAYFERAQVREAIVEYRSAVQADPKRGDVRLKLADAYLKDGDGSAALREFVQAADLLPSDLTAQMKAGHLLLMARQFEDARGRAARALELDASSIEALILMGNAMAGLKDFDGAIAEYQEAIALSPSEDAAYVNIGAIQLARGQRREAEATFLKAVAAAPQSVSARMALANFLWATERRAEAEEALQAVITLDPASEAANRALGVLLLTTGRHAEAEPYFQAAAKTADTPDAITSLSDYYVAVRRFEEAKAVLRELAHRPEAFGQATVRLAAIEAGQDNRSAAHLLVQSVLDKHPRLSAARLLQSRLYLADGKPDEAMAAATALVRDEPRAPATAEAHLVIGTIEAARDRTEDAIRAFEESLRISPQSVTASLALARVLMATGARDRAETHVMQVLSVQPSHPTARSFMVRIDLASGNSAKATADLAALEKEYPNAPVVQNLSAAKHLMAGRLDAARAAYAKAAALAPADIEALQGLITIDLRQGRRQDAINRVESALTQLAPSIPLSVLAAQTHLATGNGVRAEDLLKTAIEREPNRLAPYGLLGRIYASQKKLPDAQRQYEALVEKNPRSVAAHTMLGMVMEARQNTDGAEAQYRKTLAVDPTAAVAANNLAWILVASNRNLDEAQQLAQTALKALPDESHVNDTLGWIYYRKGMFAQAVRHLEFSVRKDPTDPSGHYHLGMAYLQSGEPEKGQQALEKALSMSSTFPGAEDARKALARLPR